MRNATREPARLHKLFLAIACLIAVHISGTPSFAQRATASITGSILDASDAAVPSASVVVRNLDTGAERTVESNGVGFYVVPALPAGRYTTSLQRDFRHRASPNCSSPSIRTRPSTSRLSSERCLKRSVLSPTPPLWIPARPH